MEPANLTPYPAILPRTVLEDDNMAASMIARVTYDLRDGELVAAAEQVWPGFVQPFESPLGALGPDQPFRKDGVDLFVIGDAHAPGGEPVAALDVSLEVGTFRGVARVFGARVWQRKGGGGWTASEPEPFATAPIGPAAAFGGHAELEGHKADYPLNPDGIGFYATEDAAENRPLPRIEDPAALVVHPLDKPDPMGFFACPFPHPLRLRESLEIVDGRGEQIKNRAYNQAHPKMITAAVSPGDRVRLTGFSADAPIEFAIPATPVRVVLQLGARRIERTPTIDEVGIDVPKRQVFIAYRYPFRYFVTRHELRTCTLTLAEV